LCCLQRISFCSESIFAAELCRRERISFYCQIVLSVVNQFLLSLPNCVVCSESVFVAELCYLQRIGFSLNCVVCSESVSLWNYVVGRESVFAAELYCL
jgi:hypothetical protein